MRFVGELPYATGSWIGVELDAPEGGNNGTIGGRQYFSCPENHGVIVRPMKVSLVTDGSEGGSESGSEGGARADGKAEEPQSPSLAEESAAALSPALVHGYQSFVKEDDPGIGLWWDGKERWWVGAIANLGEARGFMHSASDPSDYMLSPMQATL